MTAAMKRGTRIISLNGRASGVLAAKGGGALTKSSTIMDKTAMPAWNR